MLHTFIDLFLDTWFVLLVTMSVLTVLLFTLGPNGFEYLTVGGDFKFGFGQDFGFSIFS